MMTTSQPQPDPSGDTQSPWAWRETLEQLTHGLLDLISRHPDVSDQVSPLVKRAMSLRGQIEDIEGMQRRDQYLLEQLAPHRAKGRGRLVPREPWALVTERSSLAQQRMWLDAPFSPSVPKRYRVDDHNLKEVTTSPQGETTLQINFDYYVRVAEALERLAKAHAVQSGKRAGVAARRIMTQTKREEVDEHSRGETVSLTHVYICMRFWMDSEIIERPIRGQFKPVDAKHPFTTIAIDTWKQLEAQTD